MIRIRPSKKVFYKLYYKNRLTIKVMAAKFGVHERVISKWRTFYRFPKRGWANGHPRKGKKGPPSWNKGLPPEKSPLWKGGRFQHQSGYVYIYVGKREKCGESRYIAEHRYVMEKKLGRKLQRNEHVHHKNGIKTDNRLSNLCVHSASEHAKEHYRLSEKVRETLKHGRDLLRSACNTQKQT